MKKKRQSLKVGESGRHTKRYVDARKFLDDTDSIKFKDLIKQYNTDIRVLRVARRLLDSKLVIKNNYFNLYIDTIEKFLDYPRIATETHQHHTIPVHCYCVDHPQMPRREREIWAELDSNNLLVNVPIDVHLKLHIYLVLSASNDWFRNKNIFFIARSFNIKIKDLTNSFLEDLLSKPDLFDEAVSRCREIQDHGMKSLRKRREENKIHHNQNLV